MTIEVPDSAIQKVCEAFWRRMIRTCLTCKHLLPEAGTVAAAVGASTAAALPLPALSAGAADALALPLPLPSAVCLGAIEGACDALAVLERLLKLPVLAS